MGAILSSILYQPYEGHLCFLCPACMEDHIVRISNVDNSGWTWNHDITAPSFTPSIRTEFYKMSEEGYRMIREGIRLPEGVKRYPGAHVVCHSWVTDGNIRFFEDSTHELAGKTVPLIPHRHTP